MVYFGHLFPRPLQTYLVCSNIICAPWKNESNAKIRIKIGWCAHGAQSNNLQPFATIWKCQFISERLLRLLKSSESINLREGYAIFEDFKNAIKTMIKTGYIKSSISIESSFHVEYNELGFNSVKLEHEQIITLTRKCRVRNIYITSWLIWMTKFCTLIWYNINITHFKFQVNSSDTLENTAIFVSVLYENYGRVP